MNTNAQRAVANMKGARGYRTWRNLIDHARNAQVRFSGQCFYWIDPETQKQTSLTGIRSVIEDCFAGCNVSTVMAHWYKQQVKAGLLPRPLKAPKGRSQGSGFNFGKRRGTFVHQLLHDWFTLSKAQFALKHPQVHDWMLQLFDLIAEHADGWVPMLPEFQIFDEELRIGTAVDLIARDRDNNIVLLEFKTGYSGFFAEKHETRFYRGPFSRTRLGLAFSPLHDAQLQLWLAMLILKRRYGIPYARMKAYVLNVGHGVCNAHFTSTKFIQDHEAEIVAALQAWRRQQEVAKEAGKPSTPHARKRKRSQMARARKKVAKPASKRRKI